MDEPLPDSLVAFLERNGIRQQDYRKALEHKSPRYIFIKNSIDPKEIEEQILAIFSPASLEPLPFLQPPIYKLDPSIPLPALQCYRKGQILSLDITSAMAVYALGLVPSDHYLDLCCAPGAKLCLAGMLMQSAEGTGSITGVDISKDRLAVCRSMIKKYQINNARLYCQDAVSFNTGIMLQSSQEHEKDRPFYLSSCYRRYPGWHPSSRLYSKILVDAECTHDGSIKHMHKMMSSSPDSIATFFSPEHELKLQQKQLALLRHAFTLLSPDGVLVYCVCSITKAQTVDIVTRFLQSLPDPQSCTLIDDFPPLPLDFKRVPIYLSALIGHCISFDPTTTASGFFIAKFRKI